MSDEWQGLMDESANALTIEQMDDIVKKYGSLREEIQSVSEELKALELERRELEHQIISNMEATGKSNWQSSAHGKKAILVEKESYTLPKEIEKKQKVFDWVKKEFGDEGLKAYLTINAQSFNKLIKDTKEAQPDFYMEEIGEPFKKKTLTWRK